MFIKRCFDITASSIGLLILLPLFIIIGIIIIIDSTGGVFYKQERIGLDRIPFLLYKFRTMRSGSDKKGLLTVGDKDNRITKTGYYLRKYKVDELPQLINVFIGNMSFVGPRPEVKKYVDLYSPEQRNVLSVKPGITDYASLKYFEENKILGESSDPERTYIEEVMPQKLAINLEYLQKRSMQEDLLIIFKTLLKIIK